MMKTSLNVWRTNYYYTRKSEYYKIGCNCDLFRKLYEVGLS